MGSRRLVAALALVVVADVLGCGASDRPDKVPPVPALRDAASPGRLTSLALVEASGLVRSSREPNVFWSHNDSGNDERLFAFDSTGRALGSTSVAGAKNRDWEALAIGPCDRGSCIYLGDIGDNLGRRDEVRIWRFAEPAARDSVTSPVERLTFRYVDGPRDVEAIWVTPDTSVYLLTKRPDRDPTGRFRSVRIYRLAASAWRGDSMMTAIIVDSLPIVARPSDGRGWITDAALSAPDSAGARRLGVRTYSDVYVFGLDTITWRPTALIARCSLRALRERNSGEGVTWLADGRLMFGAEGESARLHAGRCP